MKKSDIQQNVFYVKIDLTINQKPIWDKKSYNGTPIKNLAEKFKQAGYYSGISRVLDLGELVRTTTTPPESQLSLGNVDLNNSPPTLTLRNKEQYQININHNSAFLI